jgi:hypothetical protein
LGGGKKRVGGEEREERGEEGEGGESGGGTNSSEINFCATRGCGPHSRCVAGTNTRSCTCDIGYDGTEELKGDTVFDGCKCKFFFFPRGVPIFFCTRAFLYQPLLVINTCERYKCDISSRCTQRSPDERTCDCLFGFELNV